MSKRKTATKTTRNPDGSIEVKYHSTTVVHVDKDGTITLNHGGWMTATTKARMNEAADEFGLGYSVYQEKGKWFVWMRQPDRRLPFPEHPNTITFKVV